MTKDQIISKLLAPGVVAVIRAENSEQLVEACGALIQGGITSIEITMTTPHAMKVIADVCGVFGDKVLVGVGTVLDVNTAEAAIEAGAQYIVTPVLKVGLITYGHRMGKPIISGSSTSTEVQTAYKLDADLIKIFLAEGLGPKYIQAIRGPLPYLRIIPAGGIDLNTVGEFIRAGCVAVAAGSTLVSKEILQTRNWAKLTDLAGQFTAAVDHARRQVDNP